MHALTKRFRPDSITLLMAILLGMASIFAGKARSVQAGDESVYRNYRLQRANADEVRGILAPLMPQGCEVDVDRGANSILVRGSQQAQQIAQRALQSLDSGSPQRGAAAREPMFKVHSCPSGMVENTTAQLQEEFGRIPGVRIVADQRTSQILVSAPADVQAKISRRLAAPGAARNTRPVATVGYDQPAEAAATASAPPVSREVQLRRLTAQQFESAIASLFATRLAPAATGGPDAGVHRVRLSEGSEVAFTVDQNSGRVVFNAPPAAAASFAQLIRTLDAESADDRSGRSVRLMPLRTTKTADVRRTVDAIRSSNEEGQHRSAAATPATTVAQVQAGGQPAQGGAAAAGAGQGRGEGSGLVGPVQIEMLEGLDVLVIRGNRQDVQQVVEIIKQIEELSKANPPAIEVYMLTQTDCSSLATLVTQVYNQVYLPRQGSVTIVPLVKPNAFLLIGKRENVDKAIELTKTLDVPVNPDSQFKVFRLKHAAAATAQATIEEFYANRATNLANTGTGLAPVVTVSSDVRSNSLIVQASPRDLAEVAALVERLDTKDGNEAVNELRVFKLINSVAADLATTLKDAIQSQGGSNQATSSRTGGAAGGAGRQTGTAGAYGAAGQTNQRSSTLQFVTIDEHGQKRLNSGILSDVLISYDVRANTVIVEAPAESMPLIDALIKQLDQPPAVRAEVKVFNLKNGDASSLVSMLNQFFRADHLGKHRRRRFHGREHFEQRSRGRKLAGAAAFRRRPANQ